MYLSMDIKMESQPKYALCQGCLSSNRNTSRVNGPCFSLFYELLGDHKNIVTETTHLLLCWECTATLRKLQLFQRRIRNAQCLLMQYIHSFCQEEPDTLSTLCLTKPKEYDLEITDKSTQNTTDLPIYRSTELPEITENIYQKASIQEEEMIIDNQLIKEETTDNISIKEEDYESIDYSNHTDYDYDIKSNVRKKSCTTNGKKLQIVIKTTDLDLKDVGSYFEVVHLNETDMEIFLRQRDSKRSKAEMRHHCNECNRSYMRRLDLCRHRTFHHQKTLPPHKCLACGVKLESEQHLADHWSRVHSQMMRCTLCSEICRSIGEMKKHLHSFHAKQYTCTVCDGNFNSLAKYKSHCKESHAAVYICDYCNKKWMQKRSLEKHIRRLHMPPYCQKCKRTYASYHVLKTHTRLYHPELTGREFRPELAYCVECDRQYPSVDQYRKHLRQSVKHRPRKIVRVPCPVCGKVFTKTTYMNNHYKMVHKKATNHYCGQCNKYFVTGFALRTHIAHVHQKMKLPKNKLCDLCGRGFSTNRILANHRRTHTGERPYKCKFCPASFAQQTAMNTHQRTQHKNAISLELTTG